MFEAALQTIYPHHWQSRTSREPGRETWILVTRIFSASDVGYSKPDSRAFNKQLSEVAQNDGIDKEEML